MLQQFIHNTLLFAQAVGANMKNLMDRVYQLELINIKPVQYVNQLQPEPDRLIARNNIRTNAIFRGTNTPSTINWSNMYPDLVLKNGDKYIRQNFSSGIREEYTYFEGNGTSIQPGWLKNSYNDLVIPQIKKANFTYDGSDNEFDVGEPITEILDIMIDNGANFDEYVLGFISGSTSITIDDNILSNGNKIKIIYKS